MEESAKQILKPDHISYREYKKRLAKKPHQSFVIFVSAFFVLLLAFLGVAKVVSPKVDLAIGDEPAPAPVVSYESDSAPIEKGSIDDRLKKIQEEDNSFTGAVDSGFSYELDEKVVLPSKYSQTKEVAKVAEDAIELDMKGDSLIPKSVKEQIKEIKATNNSKGVEAVKTAKVAPAPVPTQAQAIAKSANTQIAPTTPNAPIPVASSRAYKVYVGNYDSAAQAEVAKVIIAEAGLSMNTFVKNINGSYTLQAGSYSSQDTAFAVAEDLLKNNFPARVVAE